MTQTVGKVYAEALFLLAQEEGKEEQIYHEINEAADLLAQYPDFVLLLSVPTLSMEERLDVLRKVIGDGAGVTEHFLFLLVEKRRINRIAEIRAAFNAMYYEKFSIEEVSVITAVPMEDAQREALTAKMQKKLQKTVKLIEQVDPDILGGMIVQYGDTRMDNSLRTRMREFARNAEQS